MKNIDKEMIKNIVNDLVFIENYKRYILRCDLEKLEESVKEYVINYISKTNIQVVDYEINRKNRTKSVDDYDYGYDHNHHNHFPDLHYNYSCLSPTFSAE